MIWDHEFLAHWHIVNAHLYITIDCGKVQEWRWMQNWGGGVARGKADK